MNGDGGYPDIPHQLRGLLGQNKGNGANRTVTGDISIPRYLYLSPCGISGEARKVDAYYSSINHVLNALRHQRKSTGSLRWSAIS